jgi:nitrite reductase/ring-hydroxylating ferredoxin subunit
MSWTKVLRASDVPTGTIKAVEVEGSPLVICRVSDDEAFAVEDCCSHDDAPLGGGSLSDHVIECPRHGGQFDVRSGQPVRMPAASAIDTVPTRITADGWIAVDEEQLP